jgi:hypothetical protein
MDSLANVILWLTPVTFSVEYVFAMPFYFLNLEPHFIII